MILALYLFIFASVIIYRRFSLSGRFLRRAQDGDVLARVTHTNKGRTRLYADVGIDTDDVVYFSITGERWYHRLLKGMGLASELQTGDLELDGKIFFMTDTPDHVWQLMQDKNFSARMRHLFLTLNIKALRWYGSRLWVRTPVIDSTSFNEGYKNDLIAALRDIAAGFAKNPSYGGSSDDRLLPPRFAGLLLMAAHAAFFSVACFGLIPALVETEELLSHAHWIGIAAPAGVVALGIWLSLTVFFVGGTSWMPLVVADFVLFGIVGIFATSFFLTREVNIALDTHPAEVMTRAVSYQDCVLTCKKGSGKRSRTSTYTLGYTQCVKSARPQTVEQHKRKDYKCARRNWFKYRITVAPVIAGSDKPYRFDANESLFDRTRPDALLDIPVHPGALGLSWVDTDDIAPAK
jgi:hypothetical protein